MTILEKLFIKLRYFVSRRQEKGLISSGYFPPRIRDAALKLCFDEKGSILDVGCGEGLFLASLAKVLPKENIIGVDNHKEFLLESNKRLNQERLVNISTMVAEAKFLPFKNRCFDVVVCLNVLYNLSSKEDLILIIREMIRVCKRGGNLIFDIRNKRNPLFYLAYKLRRYYDTTHPYPVILYCIKEIAEILEKEKFCITKKVPIGFSLGLLSPAFVIQAQALESQEAGD